MNFRQQLILTVTLGILCFAITSTIVTTSITYHTVYNQLSEEGLRLTDNFARQSKLALLYYSPDNAKEAVASTLTFPGVLGVGIYNPDQESIVIEGDNPNPPNNLSKSTDALKIEYEDDSIWLFVSPAFTGSNDTNASNSPFTNMAEEKELIGYVRVLVSKNTLHALQQEILVRNISITIFIFSILLIALLLLTSHATRPIKALALNMKRAEKGEPKVRAKLAGPLDIREMNRAFNTMMHELEQREAALQRARDTALASARIKGEFAANITHELRTPMNGVMGMLELLNGTVLTQTQLNYTRVATESSHLLLGLVDQILDFSKLESGKIKLHPEDFNTREMLKDIIELLSLQASNKNLILEYDATTDVPFFVRADAGRLRQILINLVGNAIKFTGTGNIKVQLNYFVGKDNISYLEGSVTDTGIGIPEHLHRQIFDAFAQVDGSTTRDYGGTGLGLAICKQLIELMGGKLSLRSQMDKGSIFSFFIPIEEVSINTLTEHDYSELEGSRVLFSTSHNDRHEWILENLSQWDCHLRPAKSSREALTRLKSAAAEGLPYDLLILDANPYDVSPSTFFEQLETYHSHLPIPVVTLFTEDGRAVPDTMPSYASCLNFPLPPWEFHNLIIRMIKFRTFQTSPPQQRTPTWTNFNKGTRVLVVDDNYTNQLVATGLLESLGCVVELANNGEEAINALTRDHYDAVLMDCVMPGENGYNTTKRIRMGNHLNKTTPVIAVTANTIPGEIERCLSAGMNDYLEKPIDCALLSQKLAYWVKKSDQRTMISPSLETTSNSKDLIETTVDLTTLHALRDKIGGNYPQAIRAFLEDSPIDIKKMRIAISEQDIKALLNVTLRLKGGALNFSASLLARACINMESAVKTNQQNTFNHLLATIQKEYDTLAVILRDDITIKEAPILDQNSNGITVLITDDDRSSRFALLGAFADEGYALIQAENGEDAIEACMESKPDLVILDIMMPVMDGYYACRSILDLASEYKPIIIMATALNDDEAIAKAIDAGATDFVTKPINLSALRCKIAKLLGINQNTQTRLH